MQVLVLLWVLLATEGGVAEEANVLHSHAATP